MGLILKILVIVTAVFFTLLGVMGLFQPAQLAETLGFGLPTPDALGNMRAMIGAHYAAMGAVCILAIVRQNPTLLFPVAMIEAMMLISRGIAAVNGEFTSATVGPTLIETAACAILFTASWRSVFSR